MTLTLETERCTLRKPKAEDWSAFRDFYLSDRAKAVGGPMHIGPSWRHFAAEIGHWDMLGYGMWAVTLRGNDTAVGLVGPWTPIDWPETEVGWIIFDETLEGTGIATEAAQAAIAHAYAVLKWDTVVSYIAPGNTRSQSLAGKLGAALDPNAPVPDRYPDTLVFRHPKPESLK